MKSAEEILSKSASSALKELMESVINSDCGDNVVISAREMIAALDEAAEQFKPKWMPPSNTEAFNSAESNRIVVLFENGNTKRWDEKHYLSDGLIVGYFILPEPPETVK